MLFLISFSFISLGFIVLEEEHSNEEVEEEERPNENEYHKVVGIYRRSILLRPLINGGCINHLEHDIRPPLQASNDKESHHS